MFIPIPIPIGIEVDVGIDENENEFRDAGVVVLANDEVDAGGRTIL